MVGWCSVYVVYVVFVVGAEKGGCRRRDQRRRAPNLSLAGAATSIIFVATKDVFCRGRRVFVATKGLSRQKMCFVAADACLLRQKVCRDKRCVLSRQTRVCCDKRFVATKMILVAAVASDMYLTLGFGRCCGADDGSFCLEVSDICWLCGLRLLSQSVLPCVCVFVCVRACVRACVRVCVCACV